MSKRNPARDIRRLRLRLAQTAESLSEIAHGARKQGADIYEAGDLADMPALHFATAVAQRAHKALGALVDIAAEIDPEDAEAILGLALTAQRESKELFNMWNVMGEGGVPHRDFGRVAFAGDEGRNPAPPSKSPCCKAEIVGGGGPDVVCSQCGKGVCRRCFRPTEGGCSVGTCNTCCRDTSCPCGQFPPAPGSWASAMPLSARKRRNPERPPEGERPVWRIRLVPHERRDEWYAELVSPLPAPGSKRFGAGSVRYETRLGSITLDSNILAVGKRPEVIDTAMEILRKDFGVEDDEIEVQV